MQLINFITMSYTPKCDITGFVFISMILLAFILVIAIIPLIFEIKIKVQQTIKKIQKAIAKKRFNKFYDDIIANKILLSAEELQTIQHNYMNV